MRGRKGIAVGVTDNKREMEALRRSEREFRTIAENATDLIARFDRSRRHLYVNPALCHTIRMPRESILGKTITEVGQPRGAEEQWEHWLQDVLDSGRERRVEFYVDRPDTRVYYSAWIVPELDESGESRSVLTIVRDVTERRSAEEVHRFLASSGDQLAASLDVADTVSTVARLTIPFLADMCVIDLVNADGFLERGASAHSNPEMDANLYDMRYACPIDVNSGVGLAVVMRSGLPQVTESVTDSDLRPYASNDEEFQSLRGLGIRSAMVLPLVARGKALGVMTLAYCESNRNYRAGDVPLAEETARRCALAIDNACLYGQVQQMNRSKDEFIAMLGHELRNPLAAVSNALHAVQPIHLMVDPSFQSAQEEMLRQVGVMARLVDDLLDVTRVTHGLIRLTREPLDLCEIATGVVQSLKSEADSKAQNICLRIPPEGLPALVDGIRVHQILTNLLQNAIKYTQHGGRIDVVVERSGANCILRVVDNGIGISHSLMPFVFDLFCQGDATGACAEGGVGIGLTLVRRLVEMHEGSIEVHSDGPGRGSEFVVVLPLGNVPAVTSDSVATPVTARPAPERRAVLVADDNALAAKMLVEILESDGHVVYFARDGVEALALAAQHRPEICLLDISLPRMDGYDVAGHIRARPELDGIRLIALTGYGSPEDRQRALAAGFEEHLVKPLNLSALEAVLRLPPR